MKLPNLNGKICSFTGHRPQKLGGFGDDVRFRLRGLATYFLIETDPFTIISGMALGWDQAVCEAAQALGIPVIAAIPFVGQERAWPMESQRLYHKLLADCHSIVTVCPGGYAASKMQVRNEWMVDESDVLGTLWDGTSGGTANCVAYAKRVGRPMIHLWDEFVRRGGPPIPTEPKGWNI